MQTVFKRSIVTSTRTTMSNSRPIVLSGPSGTGKSTLLKKLFEQNPGRFGFSISHTTRSPRPGETDGKEYHFVTREAFEDLISKNAFIEHAQFSSNYYGTSVAAVEDVGQSGKQCILDIDSQGVKSIKRDHAHLNALFIFIAPPSLKILKERLAGRKTESEAAINQRLAASKQEIEYARGAGIYDVIIVNDDLERALTLLQRVTVESRVDGGDRLPDFSE